MEFDRDLVATVEGIPSDVRFGTVVRGSTSLRLKIPLRTLGSVLDLAAIQFSSTEYKKSYPDIDNLMPIDETMLVGQLDEILDKDFQSGKAKTNAVLFAPSFRKGDMKSAEFFAFGRRTAGQALAPYIQYGSWESHLSRRHKTPSVRHAKDTPVHMIDEAGDSFETRSVYECLGYELAKDGQQYILSSGVWYRADVRFTRGIDRLLRELEEPSTKLPAWDKLQNEDAYNTLCCKIRGMLHFDKKIINFGGGQSKFEFCDFMHPGEKILFFAKIASRSSDCSHLVEQAKRTAELVFGPDAVFRNKLKASIKKHYPKASTSWLDGRPRPGEWKFCLVSLGPAKEELPLFAKCSVARLVRSLDQGGHPVLFAQV